jgi:adenosine deaminase
MSLSLMNVHGLKINSQNKRSQLITKNDSFVAFRGNSVPSLTPQLDGDVVQFSNKASSKDKLNKITPELHQLFEKLPKTELHMHLSGSTPLSTIREIMRENGMSEEEIAEATDIDPNFEGLDDFLKTYYKVAWVVQKPEHFKKAAYQICMDAAEENVRYLEIRTSAIGKGAPADDILQAVSDGINQARKELSAKGFDQKARIIVLSQRHHSPLESMKHAVLAEEWAKKPGSLVVGFDVAGPEDGYPISFHEMAIKYAANSPHLKVTVHAGETPGSKLVAPKKKPGEELSEKDQKKLEAFGNLEVATINELAGANDAASDIRKVNKGIDVQYVPSESMKKAIQYGTDRLGHGVHIYDDPEVFRTIKEKQIPIESPPWCNVQLGSVDSYQAHPIKKMLDDGINVSLSTDNRTISSTTLTREYEELYANKVVTDWNDIKNLVINGAKSVFLPPHEREQLVKDFEQDLENIENNPVFSEAIDKYLSPARKAITFAGRKLADAIKTKAA